MAFDDQQDDVKRKRDSSLAPLLAGNTGASIGLGLAEKFLPTKLKTVGSLAGGFLGYQGGMKAHDALAENNYYDTVSMPELAAELGGDFGGGALGGALAGKALGGALGSWAGPIGMIAGSTLGGWLLPKLIPTEKHKGEGWGTLGTLAGLGLLSTRTAAPLRKMIGKQATRFVPQEAKQTLSAFKQKHVQPHIDSLYRSPLGEAHRAGTASYEAVRNRAATPLEAKAYGKPVSMVRDVTSTPSYMEGVGEWLKRRYNNPQVEMNL